MNPARGEAELRCGDRSWTLRPSFEALVAAEGEVGPLFALVERAAEGRLSVGETVALLWHCLSGERPERAAFGEAVVGAGLANALPAVRAVLGQVLAGR